jgi:serine/threonine-protein kinase
VSDAPPKPPPPPPPKPLPRQSTLSPAGQGDKVLFGHYEIVSIIGRGGMAAVYRAVDLHRGWTVAVKRILPQHVTNQVYVARFLNEAELCQQLSHPNIITVYESGVLQGIHYIAMEFLDGRDLAQVIKRCAERGVRLPVDFAVFLAHSLLLALDCAHTARDKEGYPLGIVHCDVSPSNLFISRTGEIKLGDFGIARSASGTASEVVEGKPYYLSPEAIAGFVTPEADLWAAAATLYELLTLHKPFTGKNPDEVFAAICKARPVPVRSLRPDVPEPLSALVSRALSPKPGQRFGTAAAFASALEGQYDERIGTPLAIAAVVRGMFG